MKKNTLINGALSLTVSVLIVKVLGVLYKVPLSYILTDVGMGYFNTAYCIYGVFYVISTAGVPKAITCVIAENDMTNPGTGHIIYKHSLRLFTLIGAALSVLYLASSPFLVNILGNEKALYTVMLIGPSILFVSTGGVCRGYLSSKGVLIPIAVSQALEAVMKLVFGVLFAVLGSQLNLDIKHISALAITGITIGSAVSSIFMYLYIKIKFNELITRQNISINKRLINVNIFKIALPITLGAAVLTCGNLIDVGLIMNSFSSKGITSSEANELYGNYSTLAVPMINLITSLVAPITVAMLPRLIELRTAAKSIEIKREVERDCYLTSLFICPCASVLFFYSFDVLDVLFSSPQSLKGYQPLAILALGVLFLAVLNVLNTAHEAMGHFYIPIISILIGMGVRIALSVLFINKFNYGINSIPLSTTISYFISFMISLLLLNKNGVSVSLFKSVLTPSALSVVCFGIPYFYIYKNGILGGGFMAFFSCNLLSFLFYCSMLALIIMSIKRQKCNYKQKNS